MKALFHAAATLLHRSRTGTGLDAPAAGPHSSPHHASAPPSPDCQRHVSNSARVPPRADRLSPSAWRPAGLAEGPPARRRGRPVAGHHIGKLLAYRPRAVVWISTRRLSEDGRRTRKHEGPDRQKQTPSRNLSCSTSASGVRGSTSSQPTLRASKERPEFDVHGPTTDLSGSHHPYPSVRLRPLVPYARSEHSSSPP